MHQLSVPGFTEITVVDKDTDHVKRKLVADLDAVEYVYDNYGQKHELWCHPEPKKEKLYKVRTTSGEDTFFGETHTVLCRKKKDAELKRVSIAELDSITTVQMVSRKSFGDPQLSLLVEVLDNDIVLVADKGSELSGIMKRVAFLGVKAASKAADPIIEIDDKRPKCFSAKLLNGNFDRDLSGALNSLIVGGIVHPVKNFDSAYLEEVKTKGVLIEGNSVFNTLPLSTPISIEKEAPVYHISVSRPNTPIELTWFQS